MRSRLPSGRRLGRDLRIGAWQFPFNATCLRVDQRLEQVILAVEVVVERALRDPRLDGDLVHASTRIAVQEKNLSGTVEDLTLLERAPEIRGSPVMWARIVTKHDQSVTSVMWLVVCLDWTGRGPAG